MMAKYPVGTRFNYRNRRLVPVLPTDKGYAAARYEIISIDPGKDFPVESDAAH